VTWALLVIYFLPVVINFTLIVGTLNLPLCRAGGHIFLIEHCGAKRHTCHIAWCAYASANNGHFFWYRPLGFSLPPVTLTGMVLFLKIKSCHFKSQHFAHCSWNLILMPNA
jgi:hypothetical protein